MNFNLLELCGKGYVIEHYISFLNKEREQEEKERSYRAYITDALKVIANNSAHKENDMIINKRWIDLIEPVKAPETTADKVISDMKSKLFKFCGK